MLGRHTKKQSDYPGRVRWGARNCVVEQRVRLVRHTPALPGSLYGFLARLSESAKVSGLQHSDNIVSPAHFSAHGTYDRPALCLPRADPTAVMSAARGLGPLDDTPRRIEVLVAHRGEATGELP
jgi:hypothetical protein